MGRLIMVKHIKINRPGLSLLELCIAMLIFGLASLMLGQFTINAFMGSRDAKGRCAASLSAGKKLQDLRLAPFTANGSDKDTVDNVVCNRSWTIKDTNNVKRIQIVVTYKSFRGTDRQFTLTGASR
jgi:Tfp pilus assembly protein PilV